MNNNIGLFFGSFNPIHIGHLIIAQYILNKVNFNQIWFVISPLNPLKDKNILEQETIRKLMLEQTIQDNPKFKVIDIEFNMPKPSYTINTLDKLQQMYPQYKFNLIIGMDNWSVFDKWKDYKRILDEYDIYIYPRLNYDKLSINKSNIHFLDAPIINISSTSIRQMIKHQENIKYMVSDITKDFIEKNNLYK